VTTAAQLGLRDETLKKINIVRQKNIFVVAGFFAFIFLSYVFCLFPTVGGGDSGELVAAAATLGVAHPPGYPLYTLLGHLFSFLPWGSVAWRINLFSAVSSVGACWFLFLSLQKINKNQFSALIAVGLYAFSPLIWRYSEVAEVFSLNNFFATVLIYLFVSATLEIKNKYLYSFYFVSGLALSHHHTILFVIIPLLFSLEWTRAQTLNWGPRERRFFQKVLLKMLIGGLGLLPYLYLVLRARQVPLITWGDTASLEGFLHHLLRMDYGAFKLSSATVASDSWIEKSATLWLLNKSFSVALLGVGWIPFVLGFRSIKKNKQILIPIAAALFLYIFVFLALGNLPATQPGLWREVISRFWLLPTLLVFFFVGVGLPSLLKNRWAKAFAILLVMLPFFLHWQSENQSHNQVFADYGRYLMRPLPLHAVYLLNGDLDINTTLYLRYVENEREDLDVINRVLLAYPWSQNWVTMHHSELSLPNRLYNQRSPDGYDAQMLIRKNPNLNLFFSNFSEQEGPLSPLEVVFFPYGLAYQAVFKSTDFDIQDYLKKSSAYLVDPDSVFAIPPSSEQWESYVYENYWLAHERRAFAVLEWAEVKKDPKIYLQFLELNQQLIDKRQEAEDFKNRGIAFQRLAALDPDKVDFYQHSMKQSFQKYLQLKTKDGPDDLAIQRLVEQK
jgi:hypothetical protein